MLAVTLSLAASLGSEPPKAADDELRRGLVALNRNDLANARQSLQKASTMNPENPLVWAALAQAMFRSGEAKAAADAARKAGALAPGNPVIQHALAMYYSEAGDFSAAAEWERAALVHQDAAAMHDLLGRAYRQLKQPGKATEEFRAAVARAPESESFAFDLGQTELQQGDFAGALKTFDAARGHFPTSAQIQLGYGVAAYGQRRFTEAIDSFLRVTQIDPRVEQPYIFLARILDQAGDRMPEIVAAYAAWTRMEPDNYLPWCLDAKARSSSGGDTAEIESELRRSIRLNGSFWESHFQLGLLLAGKQQWQTAAAELSRSIELNPGNAVAHFQLARVYDRLGRPEQAQAERAEHARLTAAETGSGQAYSPEVTSR